MHINQPFKVILMLHFYPDFDHSKYYQLPFAKTYPLFVMETHHRFYLIVEIVLLNLNDPWLELMVPYN